ncbi:hypothetical protein J6590_026553 [Homalodisca vitripennis]|nr:hypothetical protein J6590_026553 [Homalodisca vitripennis]
MAATTAGSDAVATATNALPNLNLPGANHGTRPHHLIRRGHRAILSADCHQANEVTEHTTVTAPCPAINITEYN